MFEKQIKNKDFLKKEKKRNTLYKNQIELILEMSKIHFPL